MKSTPLGTDPDIDHYADVLATLSHGSVTRRFDPYIDIDWDDPEFTIRSDDDRWILPASDPFGAHPWYRALPRERQISIGMWRQANVAKVGLQFENLLIRGLMQHVFALPNGSPEFRYCTHEAIEECNHTMMFQELVNRIGVEVGGMRAWVRMIGPAIPLVASIFPEWFFTMVLAGEEPIDHAQKTILRANTNPHPLLERVMSIHVAEEARHISFAHEYLRHAVPKLGPVRRFVLSLLFAPTMRIACDLIAVPTREFRKECGVPRRVVHEVFWGSPESRKVLRGYFADVRMLADELGLMNPVARPLWKLCRIDGPASRYRSEPARAA
ncbi:AurF N-oxygenase family protein [Nocardia cyriacigeorgica]|uniref:AurF N-oxygenase family protein n=1 Tax=Nocardia cyriacigeorgica TaxID=135487 RepID=UPI0013D25825|nr:diiron oxygenase [Nocardia cyriacigeorgica]NEW26900.1 diiron oxygenase [Nocardia cyriacigeorgica]